MLKSLLEYIDWFDNKKEASKVVIILIFVVLLTNYYWYRLDQENKQKIKEKNAQITGLNTAMLDGTIRFNATVLMLQSKIDSCNYKRLEEIIERERTNEQLFKKYDELYHKVNSQIN